MKRYKFELIVEEGCDEFWESLEGKTGCDEVHEFIKTLIECQSGLHCDGDYQNCDLRIVEYKA